MRSILLILILTLITSVLSGCYMTAYYRYSGPHVAVDYWMYYPTARVYVSDLGWYCYWHETEWVYTRTLPLRYFGRLGIGHRLDYHGARPHHHHHRHHRHR